MIIILGWPREHPNPLRSSFWSGLLTSQQLCPGRSGAGLTFVNDFIENWVVPERRPGGLANQLAKACVVCGFDCATDAHCATLTNRIGASGSSAKCSFCSRYPGFLCIRRLLGSTGREIHLPGLQGFSKRLIKATTTHSGNGLCGTMEERR
jgi:hypothetical protein